MRRLLIAGTGSGCGKTTLTCALLAAFAARGIKPTPFKCGPDYIDPMFHRAVSGRPAYTLDPFFLDGEGLRLHLAAHAGEMALIEGAMGFYDGIAAGDAASAYTVARETGTPVVLVVSAKGVGASLGALLEGFRRHRPESGIRGVIFNDAPENRAADLERIASGAGLRMYGTMPRNEVWSLPSRHLGLWTPDELEGLQDTLRLLGEQAARSLDLEGLLTLAERAPELRLLPQAQAAPRGQVRLAVAKDAAFCFLYEENLELLRALGCELVFFSPLCDRALPAHAQGLYLCGGYPELHAKELSANAPMRERIRQAIERGMPAIAEGGGFLYLHEKMGDLPMCKVIAGRAAETERLQNFGYLTLTARQDNLLCRAGESIRSRAFHTWQSDDPGEGFLAQKAGREIRYSAVHASHSLYAGFPQLYFPANPRFAERFVERMMDYEP